MLTSSVFLNHSLSYFLRQCLSLILPVQLDRLTSEFRRSGSLHLPCVGATSVHCYFSILCVLLTWVRKLA